MAIVKCTQLKGLADKTDYTCEHTHHQPKRYTHINRRHRRTRHVDQVRPSLVYFYENKYRPNKCSIESNVVIIASCIPTLQPVLELILGKRTTSSYNNSRNRYKGSSQLPDSSYDHSRLSKPRKPDYEITTVGSQESILREEDNGRNIESHPMGAIRRTDNVTVEYESRSREDPEDPRVSW